MEEAHMHDMLILTKKIGLKIIKFGVPYQDKDDPNKMWVEVTWELKVPNPRDCYVVKGVKF